MSYVHELLTAAKAAQGIPSNYRLARVLGVTDNTLNNWQAGRVAPGDAQAVRLAQMAGIDPAHVLARLAAERAKDDASRAVWQQLADRIKAGALAGVVGLVVGVSGGPDAIAAAPSPEGGAVGGLYIMFNRARRLLQRLARLVNPPMWVGPELASA